MAGTTIYQDAELVTLLEQGSESALRQLFDQLHQPLLFFAEGLIHHRAQAEDFVMVAFTKYWEKRHDFDSLAAIKSFLYTVVRNGCYKYYNQKENREHLLKTFPDQQPESDDYIESRIIIAEIIHQVHGEIQQLSPIYRDVIQLLFVEELSVKEAADRLHITPENVRKRKERGIELLRNQVVVKNLGNLALLYLVIRFKMP